MAKLRLHHKGQLVVQALKLGYVWVTPSGIFYPGFQRRLQSKASLDFCGKHESTIGSTKRRDSESRGVTQRHLRPTG